MNYEPIFYVWLGGFAATAYLLSAMEPKQVNKAVLFIYVVVLAIFWPLTVFMAARDIEGKKKSGQS